MSSPLAVSQGLEHVEEYLNTVDRGVSADKQQVKMSMYEALLYVLAAPFFSAFMRDKRTRLGEIDKRGPRFLFIHGPTLNGKSTFLSFALKFLSGYNVKPLERSEFTKSKITSRSRLGTSFPLVFDDISVSNNPGLEDLYKTYWETSWSHGDTHYPQIIMTSNNPRLKEWAKSRTKLVPFNVQFVPTAEVKEQLNRIFQQTNDLYRWFSFKYMEMLRTFSTSTDDELHIAREVFKALYDYAERPIPDYFPRKPLEETYDPGLREWKDLLSGIKKATVKRNGERMFIEFANDLEYWDIKDYIALLPQIMKHNRKGKTLIVENPSDFMAWIGDVESNGSWGKTLSRLLHLR